MPTQRVEMVAETIVQKVLTSTRRVVIIPSLRSFLAWPVRCWPMWLAALARNDVLKFLKGLRKEA